jgi:outer membrane biosynthesis protein TonB
MSRFGRLFGLTAALAGLVTAHGLALEVPPAPGVTATVPSLPVTTALPPPPSLPVTTTAPPPQPPVSPPPVNPPPVSPPPVSPPPPVKAPPPVTAPPPVKAPVTVPTPPRAATPAPPRRSSSPIAAAPGSSPAGAAAPSSAQPGAPAGARGGAGASTSTAARSGASPGSRSAAPERTERLRAIPHRSKDRVTVRLEFKLPEAKRVFVILRGPAPSCRVAGVIPVRGHEGTNTVHFAGRAGGRALRPGTYALSISNTRHSSEDAPTTFVKVVSKRRSVPARDAAERPNCAPAQLLAAGPFFRVLRGEGSTATPAVPAAGRSGGATPGATPGAAPRAAPPLPAASDQPHDVLGAAIPPPGFDSGSSAEGMESLLTIGVLTLVGAILLTAVALVARFLRGSWNP